jgi:hypothetical protein
MSSHSLRVSQSLFVSARAEGELLSRSTAQQVEHWARIGRQVEALGLSVADVAALLSNRAQPSEADLWAHKRARQAEDLQAVESGAAGPASMRLFAGGRARKARIPGSPF